MVVDRSHVRLIPQHESLFEIDRVIRGIGGRLIEDRLIIFDSMSYGTLNILGDAIDSILPMTNGEGHVACFLFS